MGRLKHRRRLAVATLAMSLVLGVLLFVGLSHGLLHEPASGHDAAMGGAVAFCLVLFTVLAPLALVAPAVARWNRRRSVELFTVFMALIPFVVRPARVSTRASPSLLQRFQN